VSGRKHSVELSGISKLNHSNVSFPSPEDGKRFSFLNIVVYSYLGFWTIDEIYKLSDSEYGKEKENIS
jgi:hypothetical protein